MMANTQADHGMFREEIKKKIMFISDNEEKVSAVDAEMLLA